MEPPRGKDQLLFDFNAPETPGGARGEAGGSLPRDASERGYEAMNRERGQVIESLERRFGVVLNKRVRLTLSGIDDEFTGKLVLDQLLFPSKKGDELRLRIGSVSFDYRDVESCVVLPD